MRDEDDGPFSGLSYPSVCSQLRHEMLGMVVYLVPAHTVRKGRHIRIVTVD